MTMSIKLFKHNQIAYTTANDMLDKVGKAAVIHPTGTGKSMIGKCSILSTLTNVRPLTWPVAMTSAVYGAYPKASVTMEVNLPKMTCRSDPCISKAL